MPLGKKLIEARQKKAFSEEQAAIETCIPLAIIRSLEIDDYSAFDSAIYAKNFLKTYSRFLELNISEVLVKFDELTSEGETIFRANREPLADTARPAPTQRSRNPLILAPVLVGLFGFLCFSLFSLFTSGSLPFAPSNAVAGEPTAPDSLAQEANLPAETEKLAVPAPATGEEANGAFIDDFHPVSSTVYLKKSGSEKPHVLP